jgi:Xaa-Pro aminopeptidase
MDRISKLLEIIQDKNLDAIFINHLPNIRYLTGFSGSSATVLLTKDKHFFISDFRYKTQSDNEVKGFQICINYEKETELIRIIDELRIKTIGFESTHMIFENLQNLKKISEGLEFFPLNAEIEQLTVQKSQYELEQIKKACEITDKTFSKILEIIKPGMTELEVSADITYTHKKLGAQKDSFEPIVASGVRGSLPHGIASDKVIENGDMVTLDFGCVFNGFCSDLTRTIALGNPSDEMKKIYDIVFEAQKMAVDNAKAGMTTAELDIIPRNFIESHGYGSNFGHGLGHGLGIEVHEIPGLSQRTNLVLKENSVITIEPGIYIENLGGVRIEDDVILKKGYCEVITQSPKKLIIV